MARDLVITADMRAAIGRELPPWIYEVTSTGVRAFARGVGYTDPVYFDVAAARAAGYRDLPAPPTFFGTPIYLPGQSCETSSRPLASEPTVDSGCTGRLDGAADIEYCGDICAGDELIAVARVTGLELRESHTLGTMLIVNTETVYSDRASGRCVAIQRRKLIHY